MSIRRQNSALALNQDCRTWWLNSPVLSILLSFGKGLVFYIPALLLALSARSREALGLDRRMGWIALVAFVGPVLIYSKWWAWYGGNFWGPRFFLFMCAPACLLMASALQERGMSVGRLAAVLAVVALSAWGGVSGYVFAQSEMDLCWRDNYANEALCWYVPEFSALWRPFVTGSIWRLFDNARWPYAVWGVVCLAYMSYLLVWSWSRSGIHRNTGKS